MQGHQYHRPTVVLQGILVGNECRMLQELLQAATRRMAVELIGSIDQLTQVFQASLRFSSVLRLELRFIPRAYEDLARDIRHSQVRHIGPQAAQEVAKRLQFPEGPSAYQVRCESRLQRFEATQTPLGSQGLDFPPRGLANATAGHIDDTP